MVYNFQIKTSFRLLFFYLSTLSIHIFLSGGNAMPCFQHANVFQISGSKKKKNRQIDKGIDE